MLGHELFFQNFEIITHGHPNSSNIMWFFQLAILQVVDLTLGFFSKELVSKSS
jgi:hypothetical protein